MYHSLIKGKVVLDLDNSTIYKFAKKQQETQWEGRINCHRLSMGSRNHDVDGNHEQSEKQCIKSALWKPKAKKEDSIKQH